MSIEAIKYKVELFSLEALDIQPFQKVLDCLARMDRVDQNFIENMDDGYPVRNPSQYFLDDVKTKQRFGK